MKPSTIVTTFSENIPYPPYRNRIKVDIGTAVIDRHSSLCTPGYWRISIPFSFFVLEFIQGGAPVWESDAVMDDFGDLVKVQP